MNGNRIKNTFYMILGTFIAALLIAECRDNRKIHDEMIQVRLEVIQLKDQIRQIREPAH